MQICIPLQSENAQLLLGQLKLSPDNFDTLVYIRDNRYYLKSTAVLKFFSINQLDSISLHVEDCFIFSLN